MVNRPLPFILIGLAVLLLIALGIRLPHDQAGAVLLALVCGGLIWRAQD